MTYRNKLVSIFFILSFASLLSSCSGKMGYGVLLWSIEDPPIMSGTVLPVYIRSNIEQIWVIGIPEELRSDKSIDKIEIPLSQLEFHGKRRRTETRAADFAEFAHIYAENLQDGLPIRESPDNSARRVYRLRAGEIIKILERVQGNPPISTTGEPLPGEWFKVLTSDGSTGFCFSFRLRLFDQNDRNITAQEQIQGDTVRDPNLEMIFSNTWFAEFYLQMINSSRINIQSFERRYRFEPGQDTGVARILLPDLERQFSYERIILEGERSWRFEGTSLSMSLLQNNLLSVQFTDNTGLRRTLSFVVLPTDINNIIMQEAARREELFLSVFNQGPTFTSSNFGTLTFISTGDFAWTGFDLLVPQLFPEETSGVGRINMDLFIAPFFEDSYDGAFTMQFTDIRTNNIFCFMYAIDSQGLRLEIVSGSDIEDFTVMRRSSSPMVIYFYRDSPF
ncbi:MAG: SH3 domain-containing protein [Treponema sp.]|jgi:hypothetical protein|nr:SH3 domain-containing protein [Treponema sp.]